MSDIKELSIKDGLYPKALKEIPSPPEKIFVRGNIAADEKCLAVVGTRKPTRYGIEAAEKIIRELADAANLTIVSGLALGIDTIAHAEAMKKGLRTIAVLGSGIDKNSIYPAQNKNLAERIIESGGAVVSEYPRGTPPLKQHFPERNRIISGFSLGTLIIEAKEKSGALITARFALEHNREVFAVPGPIFSSSAAGTNWLIKKGAKLTTSAEDILEELRITPMIKERSAQKISLLQKEEKTVFEAIAIDALTVEEIKEKTGLSTPDILSSLSMLELKNLAKRIDNGRWMRLK